MESRAFIKYASKLMAKLPTLSEANYNAVELHQMRIDTQKDINRLFSGLQNPSLPSAYRLRSAAQASGFSVDTGISQRISEVESKIKFDGGV